ncbi:cellulose biosynthesis protein BcsN [Martelella endophytica]|uniref:cellulose biosynthesis protein BcsN n=1 Tax=Martelella endophytica TaxID=1486262 RepID=UPI00130E0C51|nr:cellulose biosynthesis protein BcsN [Martelella endophytica]
MPYTSAVRNLMPEEAAVMPPPGGPAIVSVLEHQYSNAIDQRILLRTNARTPGQNYINAIFFGTGNYSPMNKNALSYQQVIDLKVDEEMREEIPGVAMKQSPYYVQNNYGPFGYAFGKGRGDDLCMYGWQQIRAGRQSLSAFGNPATIQIRVRFCESGASEDDLLGIMYGYTINAAVEAYGWNPFGDANAPPPLLGGHSAPSYPRKAYDDRPENLANTSRVLSSGTSSSATRSTATRTVSTNVGEVDVEVLPAGSLPPGTPIASPAYMPPSMPAQTIPTPAQPATRLTTPTSVSAPATAISTPPATGSAIPTPSRQTTSAPVTTTAAPAAPAPAATRSVGSIPTPPCRLLPGSTTVTCE